MFYIFHLDNNEVDSNMIFDNSLQTVTVKKSTPTIYVQPFTVSSFMYIESDKIFQCLVFHCDGLVKDNFICIIFIGR